MIASSGVCAGGTPYFSDALFEDGQVALIQPPFQIVGTYEGNIFWHHNDTNETQIWLMNRERIVRRATVIDERGDKIFVGGDFSIVGIGDMNGDELNEIVWHNAKTNETQIWFMNGEQIARRATVIDERDDKIFVGAPWVIVGCGLIFTGSEIH